MSELFFDGRLTFTKKELNEKGATICGDMAIYNDRCFHHVEGHYHHEMRSCDDSQLYCMMGVDDVTHRYLCEKYTNG